jgi:hypothetical protein
VDTAATMSERTTRRVTLPRRVVELAAEGGLVASLATGLVAGPVALAGAAGSGNGLAQAKQMLLVRSDLPSGWKGQGSVTTTNGGSGNFPGAQQLASCLGVNPSVLNLNAPSATSPNFSNNDTRYVQDNVTVFASAKVAQQEYAALANKKVPSCMTTVMQGAARQQLLGSMPQGATVGAITVSAANPSWLVPHSSGFTIAFPVTTQGVTLHSSITVISMVRGKYGNQVTFTTVGPAFSASMARHLVAAAYSRT